MRRWVWILSCAFLGMVVLLCGWLVPMHLRAVDARVLEHAGAGTPTLRMLGQKFAKERKLQPAQLVLQAARQEVLANWEDLAVDVNKLAGQGLSPADAVPARALAAGSPADAAIVPFFRCVMPMANRHKALESLQQSPRPAVQALLRCRELTNFSAALPPSSSAEGQAFDAAISICGLLLDEGRLSPGLSNKVFAAASQASYDPEPIEQALLDFLSLAEQFNWGQLVVFVSRIQEPKTLHALTESAYQAGDRVAPLFAAVALSGNPEAVARYLANFTQTGLQDLTASIRFGAGGLTELLRRNQRLYDSAVAKQVAARTPLSAAFSLGLAQATQAPALALAFKWLLYLAAGFLLAMGMHFAWPVVSALERPLQVRGLHFAREVLFALGFLLVVLLLSEPFLAQQSQKADFPFRLRLPMVGSAASAGPAAVKSSIMNQPSQLLSLLLFFVLQALLYTACLVKLAEIRRQNVPARVRLKLLENEDHLFDAGLYLGFVGTIVSFILFALGLVPFSLMAAYSSTSFGIVFVSVFKIFHLRPTRRRLLLEAEMGPAEPAAAAPSARPALLTAP